MARKRLMKWSKKTWQVPSACFPGCDPHCNVTAICRRDKLQVPGARSSARVILRALSPRHPCKAASDFNSNCTFYRLSKASRAQGQGHQHHVRPRALHHQPQRPCPPCPSPRAPGLHLANNPRTYHSSISPPSSSARTSVPPTSPSRKTRPPCGLFSRMPAMPPSRAVPRQRKPCAA